MYSLKLQARVVLIYIFLCIFLLLENKCVCVCMLFFSIVYCILQVSREITERVLRPSYMQCCSGLG